MHRVEAAIVVVQRGGRGHGEHVVLRRPGPVQGAGEVEGPAGERGVDLERDLGGVGQVPLLIDGGIWLADEGADHLEIGREREGGNRAAEHPGAVPGDIVDHLVVGGGEPGAEPGQGPFVAEAGVGGVGVLDPELAHDVEGAAAPAGKAAGGSGEEVDGVVGHPVPVVVQRC